MLATGTVVPNVASHGHELVTADRRAEYEDVDVRRQRYLENLEWYARTLPWPVYFLENSRHDFSTDAAFQDLFRTGRITLLKFPVSNHPEKGKGYQEFEMIDEAVRRLAGSYDVFLKVSGRYQYGNIGAAIADAEKGLAIDLWKPKAIAITSVFASTFSFYQRSIAGAFAAADDSTGEWIERVLYRRVHGKAMRSDVHLLSREPVLAPGTGFRGRSRRGPVGDYVKGRIRWAERTFLRSLGCNELYV